MICFRLNLCFKRSKDFFTVFKHLKAFCSPVLLNFSVSAVVFLFLSINLNFFFGLSAFFSALNLFLAFIFYSFLSFLTVFSVSYGFWPFYGF